MAFESFRSWQSRSIDQKQSTSSLLLGLSGAALGFSVSLLASQSGYIGFWHSLAFHIHCVAQLLSVAAGIAFSINRVRDFDLTAQIARQRELNAAAPALKTMRATVRRWGRMTKRLYVIQSVGFVLGAMAFIAFALLRYGSVLYPL